MRFLRRLKYLVPSIRAQEERDMNDEMKALSAIAAEEHEDRENESRRVLGNLTLAKENARAVWGWRWLEDLSGDFRYAFRVLRKQPGFLVVAIGSLALGIGANTAIFRVVNQLLIQTLPVEDPERLVVFEGGSSFSNFAYTEFARHSGTALAQVFARFDYHREVDSGGGPQRANVELVTGNYFNALGVQANPGRIIVPADDAIARPGYAAVISHAFWTQRFGREPHVIGRELRIEGARFTIVGVAPPEFFGVVAGDAVDMWVPLNTFSSVFPGRIWPNQMNTNFLTIFGRLRPDVSLKRAQEMLTPLYVQIDLKRSPDLPPSESTLSQRLHLDPAARGISFLMARFSKPLRIVFAMVGVVLLLTCVNLMNLQLARSRERRKELAVRLAIGAGRSRLIRQQLIESLIVAVCGGLIGLLFAKPAEHGLVSLAGLSNGSLLLSAGLNATVLGFVVCLSILCALLFGLLPAFRATTAVSATDLQSASRTSTAGIFARRLGRSLTAIQIALSLFLVAGACLFATSLHKLTHFETGFARSHLVMVDVDATEAGYKGQQMIALSERLRNRFAALPGVSLATISENGVFAGRDSNNSVFTEHFQPVSDREAEAFYDQVGPYYFATVGATLLEGRDFSERDTRAAPKVTVVNEQFAKHFFGEENPIGRNVYFRGEHAADISLRVIGVVKDVRSEDVRRQARRVFYLPIYQAEEQADLPSIRFLVRIRQDPEQAFGTLRRAVLGEDAALPVLSIDSADELFARTLDRDRLIAGVSLSFGVLALVLAAVGTYGLISREVGARTSEFGIRAALGAQRWDIFALVLGEVTTMAFVGVVLGVVGAQASARAVTSLVFGLAPNDPGVVMLAAGILLIAAFAAGLLPARRAARLNPVEALRNE